MAYIEELSKYAGKEVTIKGWLYNKRSGGKIHFILIRDGTGMVQAVASKGDIDTKLFEKIDKIPYESSLIIKGKVRKDERAPGGYEIQLKELKLVHSAEPYPISLKEHGIDFLLENRHLWLRSRKPFAILRIRAEVVKAIHDFFDSRGFVLLDAPLFTPSACEETTTLFEVPYFGKKAWLSQSGQLYVEAGCMAFGKVYCFGPSFRAEKSKTRRHLTEFWQVEPEVAYADLDDIMKLAEQLVSYIVERVLESKKEELKIIERDIKPLKNIHPPFPRISYTEAVKLLKGKMNWGDDFGAPQETLISHKFDKPIFIYSYPASIKPFYMKRDPEENLAICSDMLAPEGYGEIIGGSQREDKLEILEKRIKEYNLNKKDYEWYLDLRRYGSVPHSGFGLGLERFIAWICKLHHVRETIPFPRTIDRLYP
jgi:asparaginyl-tRNA synthetase